MIIVVIFMILSVANSVQFGVTKVDGGCNVYYPISYDDECLHKGLVGRIRTCTDALPLNETFDIIGISVFNPLAGLIHVFDEDSLAIEYDLTYNISCPIHVLKMNYTEGHMFEGKVKPGPSPYIVYVRTMAEDYYHNDYGYNLLNRLYYPPPPPPPDIYTVNYHPGDYIMPSLYKSNISYLVR